jgi:type II secretory pathway component PulJ
MKKIRGQRNHASTDTRRMGFTLMEVVIVMVVLGGVLIVSYRIFLNCLETARRVEKDTVPEKVGEGILTLMRRDLSGTVFKGCTEALDKQVFIGEDRPGPDGDEDSIHFVSTVDPTPREDLLEWENIRTLTMLNYRLEPNQVTNYPAYTLYRKEILDFARRDISNMPGLNYSVYDKVKSLNIEYFDGYEWFHDWDSVAAIEQQQRLQQEQEEGDLRGGVNSNIPRVSGEIAQGDEESLAEVAQQAAPIPTAVRIELEIYSVTNNKVDEKNGKPVVRKFTTLVPLLASRRLAIPIDDEMLAADGGVGGGGAGGEGDAAVTTTFNADLRGKRGEGRGKESLRDRLTERPSRGTGRGNRGGGRNAAPGLKERATNALKGRLPSGGGTSVFGKGGRGG